MSSTPPETIEHEGRTYRLVPDQAEEEAARRRRNVQRLAEEVDRLSGMSVVTARNGAIEGVHVYQLQHLIARMLVAILQEVSR